jgi:hypothetical protein
MRWAGHVARIGDRRGAYSALMGRSAGRKPIGIPRHRCENIIKMNLQEEGWEGMDCIALAQDKEVVGLVSAVMNLRFP